MPKKRKSTRKKSVSTAPKHDVPSGFWAQVGAVLLVVLSLLLMVAWFGVGGPVLEWLHKATLSMLGYAMYGLPILLIYIAVEIFRAENNRLPLAMKLAAILEVVWLSGLFGLLKTQTRPNAGGCIGDTANRAMSAMVDPGIAALIYVVLIIITALFITQTSPFMVIKKIAEALKRDHSEEDNNAAVMKKAAREDAASAKSSSQPSIRLRQRIKRHRR